MSTTRWISTPTDVATMLSQLTLSPTIPPHLFIGLEGVNLSRYGAISILTIYDRSSNFVYLIDVHNLGDAAFSTSALTNNTFLMEENRFVTLREILESTENPKVFFDARNSSDALFAGFNIELKGVQDLQLMELATRSGRNRERVNGLAKCIEVGLLHLLSPIQRAQVGTIKDRGTSLFVPEKGGSYEVFNKRPLDGILVDYCMQNVIFLPALWNTYNSRLRVPFWAWVVETETEKRLRESRRNDYGPQGQHRTLGWSWEYLRQLEREWNR